MVIPWTAWSHSFGWKAKSTDNEWNRCMLPRLSGDIHSPSGISLSLPIHIRKSLPSHPTPRHSLSIISLCIYSLAHLPHEKEIPPRFSELKSASNGVRSQFVGLPMIPYTKLESSLQRGTNESSHWNRFPCPS